MPDTLEQLKQQWQELNLRTQRLEEANSELSERLAHGRVTTNQQKLEREMRRWSVCSLALIVLAFPMAHIMEIPWWVAVIYGGFGALMGVLSYLLSQYIGKERLVDLPVTEAYERACRIHRYQWYCRYVGIVCGSGVLACMFYFMHRQGDEYMIIGAVCGVVFGLIIGIIKASRQNRLSKQIIRDFKE